MQRNAYMWVPIPHNIEHEQPQLITISIQTVTITYYRLKASNI